MKKRISITLLSMIAIFLLTACANVQSDIIPSDSELSVSENIIKLTVSINDYHFSGVLYDNAYSKAFSKMLPITLEMSNLNGNEKYYYLDDALPTASENPKQIKSGDIMLYGDNCLVLFYKSFSSSYSYTKLGYIEDISNLEKAVGGGNVTVKINLRCR